MKRPFIAFAFQKMAEIGALTFAFPDKKRLKSKRKIATGHLCDRPQDD